MRELPKDIIEEMKVKFESEFDLALEILREEINETDCLESNRIIRCVVFLTKDNVESWKSNLYRAKRDYRDIILAAEYEVENYKQKRVRDFNKPFIDNLI